MRRLLRLWSTPLWRCGSIDGGRLISLWMNILRSGGAALIGHTSSGLPVLKQLQTCLDMDIGRIQVRCTLIGIQGIGRLVVAGLVLFHV